MIELYSESIRKQIIMTIARQMDSQDRKLTAYSLSRATGLSVYKSRKSLESMVDDGIAKKSMVSHRSNVIKAVYEIDYSNLDDSFAAFISIMLVDMRRALIGEGLKLK